MTLISFPPISTVGMYWRPSEASSWTTYRVAVLQVPDSHVPCQSLHQTRKAVILSAHSTRWGPAKSHFDPSFFIIILLYCNEYSLGLKMHQLHFFLYHYSYFFSRWMNTLPNISPTRSSLIFSSQTPIFGVMCCCRCWSLPSTSPLTSSLSSESLIKSLACS